MHNTHSIRWHSSICSPIALQLRRHRQNLERQSASVTSESQQHSGPVTNESVAAKWRLARIRGEVVCTHLKTIIANVTEARDALMLPKKRWAVAIDSVIAPLRSLAELREHASNACFTPSLPPDVTLSFYVAGAKLMCASYHVQSSAATTSAATGDVGCKQTFVVVQAECTVPWLADVLSQLSLALRDVQSLHDKLVGFGESK